MSLFKSRRGEGGEEPPVSRESTPIPEPRPVHQSPPREARRERQGGMPEVMANIGKSISIKGDVIGDEDTVIEGTVEGRVELKNHHLTIGPNGNVKGEVSAKQVTVVGRITGNITAHERIELSESGRVEGDLAAPRLLVQEGAQLNGSVVMKSVGAPAGAQPAPAKKLTEVQQKAG